LREIIKDSINFKCMNSSGMLLLATCTFILIIVGMSALSDFRVNVNSTNPTIQADANMGTSAATPLFTVLSYGAIAIISIALLQTFRSL
jgi:hypothetical protein